MTIHDAYDEQPHEFQVTTDRYGATITFDGEPVAVVGLSGGELRMFRCDETGEVTDEFWILKGDQ